MVLPRFRDSLQVNSAVHVFGKDTHSELSPLFEFDARVGGYEPSAGVASLARTVPRS